MIEQVSNAVVFLAFYVESKLGKTGLTVTVDVYRNGSSIVTGGSATEIGGGLYSYTLSSGSVTVEGEYAAIFKTATATVDQRWIPALWVVGRAGIENLDAAVSSRLASASYTTPPTVGAIADQVWDEALSGHTASGSAGARLALIGSAAITVTAPVAADGNVALVWGDDYSASDGRALDFINVGTIDWPNLTGATISFTVRSIWDTVMLSVSGSVITPTAPNQKVRVELTAVNTRLLTVTKDANTLDPQTQYKFDVQAALTSGRTLTLVRGDLTVTEDETRT